MKIPPADELVRQTLQWFANDVEADVAIDRDEFTLTLPDDRKITVSLPRNILAESFPGYANSAREVFPGTPTKRAIWQLLSISLEVAIDTAPRSATRIEFLKGEGFAATDGSKESSAPRSENVNGEFRRLRDIE
jgi:hypothetical protein